MKKILTLLLLIFITGQTFSQKLVKDEVDEFTGIAVRETSLERITWSKKLVYSISYTQTDSFYFQSLEIGLPGVFSMDQNDEIMFKLSDGKIMTFKNMKYGISRTWGTLGWQALTVGMIITQEELNELIENPPVKIRVYTSTGFVEEEVAERYIDIIPNSIELLLNYK